MKPVLLIKKTAAQSIKELEIKVMLKDDTKPVQP